MKSYRSTGVAIVALICLCFAAPVHGYLDPGAGSVIIQAVLAGVLAAGVATKIFWSKIKGVFSRKKE